MVQTVSGAHPASCPKGYLGLFPGDKTAGAWNSLTSNYSRRQEMWVRDIFNFTLLYFTLLYYFNINNTVTSGVDNSKYLALDPYILLGLIFQTIFS